MDILSSFTLPHVTPNLKYFQTQIKIFFNEAWVIYVPPLKVHCTESPRKKQKPLIGYRHMYYVFLKPYIYCLVKPYILIQY